MLSQRTKPSLATWHVPLLLKASAWGLIESQRRTLGPETRYGASQQGRGGGRYQIPQAREENQHRTRQQGRRCSHNWREVSIVVRWWFMWIHISANHSRDTETHTCTMHDGMLSRSGSGICKCPHFMRYIIRYECVAAFVRATMKTCTNPPFFIWLRFIKPGVKQLYWRRVITPPAWAVSSDVHSDVVSCIHISELSALNADTLSTNR